MGEYTRGEFLGIGAALAGAFALGRAPGAEAQAPPASPPPSATAEPDFVLVNGNGRLPRR